MANPNPELHPENLRPFPKGVSPNPGGRPKATLGNDLRALLEREAKLNNRPDGHGVTNREAFLKNLFDHVMRTFDPALVRLLFQYHDGAPPDAPPPEQDQSNQGGKILEVPEGRRRRRPDPDADR